MRSALRCGTSGWAHADWAGSVYPVIRPAGFHPLEYLANRLEMIEIDSSFQRPIRPELAKLWLRKVESRPGFQFTALLGRQFTFDRELDPEAIHVFKDGLWPLSHAGKLGALLMRFPWSFRFTKENRDFLIELRRAFHEFPLAAEMRHASWTSDEALGVLMDHRVGFCNVDQPRGARATPPGSIITSPVGYVRLLGRHGSDWTRDDLAADYLYAPQELGQWQDKIERLAAHTSSTFVVTANVTGGKAAVNAIQLAAMLRQGSAPIRRRPASVSAGAAPLLLKAS